MNIVNHTKSTVFWTVQSSAQGDCGTLAPGEKFYLPVPDGPVYDVRFSAQNPTYFQQNAQGSDTVTIAVNATKGSALEVEAETAPAAAAGS